MGSSAQRGLLFLAECCLGISPESFWNSHLNFAPKEGLAAITPEQGIFLFGLWQWGKLNLSLEIITLGLTQRARLGSCAVFSVLQAVQWHHGWVFKLYEVSDSHRDLWQHCVTWLLSTEQDFSFHIFFSLQLSALTEIFLLNMSSTRGGVWHCSRIHTLPRVIWEQHLLEVAH